MADATEISSRYEFRAFAPAFGRVTANIRRHAARPEIYESVERYLIVAGDEARNIKLRDDRLEVKELIEATGGLERWQPTTSAAFPVTREFVLEVLGASLKHKLELHRTRYSPDQLLDEVVKPVTLLWAARVFKRRFRFEIDSCPTEFDELLINGAGICSVAVESGDSAAVLAVMDKIRLNEYPNINYPRAIRCIVGLEAWPEGSYYG